MKKLRVTVNGVSYDVEVEVLEEDNGGAAYGFPPATSLRPAPAPVAGAPAAKPERSAAPPAAGKKELTSPIAGTVVEIKVKVGDPVKEHDPLVVLEAMKMNTNISSPVSGKVKTVDVKAGDSVKQNQVLMTFE